MSVCSAQRSRERLQGAGSVPTQSSQRAAQERRGAGRQVDAPEGSLQGGALGTNGGKKLCLQNGAANGGPDPVSLEPSGSHINLMHLSRSVIFLRKAKTLVK